MESSLFSNCFQFIISNDVYVKQMLNIAERYVKK